MYRSGLTRHVSLSIHDRRIFRLCEGDRFSRREGDRYMFSGYRLTAKRVFSLKNGPGPGICRRPARQAGSTRGYTLIEILVATTLSLMILGGVIHLFGKVGASITESRSFLESAERLRSAQTRMQLDLAGHTVTPIPPRRPEYNDGYLVIIEGPMMQANLGPNNTPGTYSANYTNTCVFINPIPEPVDIDKVNARDTTVGDLDDVLMLTTRSNGKPFMGRCAGIAAESDVAEVMWFVRGNTLYRRQLLVAPNLFNTNPVSSQFFAWTDLPSVPAGKTVINPAATGFYANNDISVRKIFIPPNSNYVVPNTLSDLTRPECRYGHAKRSDIPLPQVYDARLWSYLGLPTAKETSDPQFVAGVWDISHVASGPKKPNVMDDFINNNGLGLSFTLTGYSNPFPKFDYWTPNPKARLTDSEIKNPNSTPAYSKPYSGTTVADDVILTNVIGFDVKVWDPGFPILQDTNTQQILKPGDANYILPGDNKYGASLPYKIIGFGGYVDLGYYPLYTPYDPTNGWKPGHNPDNIPIPQPNFHRYGDPLSPLRAYNGTMARVYDTWSNTYDLHQTASGPIQARNGFDLGSGVVDSDSACSFPTPYPAPLRGVQVKIRIFEPDSRQIREVTIQQDFLPK